VGADHLPLKVEIQLDDADVCRMAASEGDGPARELMQVNVGVLVRFSG